MQVSWDEAFKGAKDLAEKFQKHYSHSRMPCFVMVGRGGLAVASLLCRFMQMDTLLYLPFSRYHGRVTTVHEIKGFRVVNTLPLGAAQHVVLIDDIFDEGRTFGTIADSLLSVGVSYHLIAMTLYRRFPNVFDYGDHLVWQDLMTKDWVEFPWEQTPKEEGAK